MRYSGLERIRRSVAPVKIAAGEHVANRVVFKQLLQAGALDFLQIDACRVAGVNENVAILLLAAQASGFRSARTRAASACVSSFNTWRCSTTSRSPRR